VPGCCLLIVLSQKSRCVHLVVGMCVLCVAGVSECVNPYFRRVRVGLLQSCGFCLEVVVCLKSLGILCWSCLRVWEMRALIMVWLFVAWV